MEDVVRPLGLAREDQSRYAGQPFAVLAGQTPPPRVALVQVPQLDAQDRRLQLVEPRVNPFDKAVVAPTGLPAVVAQHGQSLGERRVVRADRATVAIRAEVLGG